jgi:hypothetical protein
VGNFKIYELYEKLPIIILDDESQLYDEKLLDSKINQIKNNQYDMSLLDTLYWKKIINN